MKLESLFAKTDLHFHENFSKRFMNWSIALEKPHLLYFLTAHRFCFRHLFTETIKMNKMTISWFFSCFFRFIQLTSWNVLIFPRLNGSYNIFFIYSYEKPILSAISYKYFHFFPSKSTHLTSNNSWIIIPWFT